MYLEVHPKVTPWWAFTEMFVCERNSGLDGTRTHMPFLPSEMLHRFITSVIGSHVFINDIRAATAWTTDVEVDCPDMTLRGTFPQRHLFHKLLEPTTYSQTIGRICLTSYRLWVDYQPSPLPMGITISWMILTVCLRGVLNFAFALTAPVTCSARRARKEVSVPSGSILLIGAKYRCSNL